MFLMPNFIHKDIIGPCLGLISKTYRRMTWFWESHVTWNQVQGFTRLWSQLCNTLFGSDSLDLKAHNASPVKNIYHVNHWLSKEWTYNSHKLTLIANPGVIQVKFHIFFAWLIKNKNKSQLLNWKLSQHWNQIQLREESNYDKIK